VDTVPFTGNDNKNRQLFIECELKNSGKTEAFISHPVNLGDKGMQFEPVSHDDLVVTVAEMNKDIVYPFVFDDTSNRFFINHDSFILTPGRNYILKAYMKGSTEELYSMIEMPGKFWYDSITCTGATFERKDNQTLTKAFIRLYTDKFRGRAEQYLHLVLSDVTTGKVIPFAVSVNQQDFFMLNHRPGLLWFTDGHKNYDFIDFLIQYTGNGPLEEVMLTIKNTTKSYYDYHKFLSNVPNLPGPSANPAIAGLNIFSAAGYGSFSASYEDKVKIALK